MLRFFLIFREISAMTRTGIVLMMILAVACNNKSDNPDEEGEATELFFKRFPVKTLPYRLSDTGLQKNKDTAVIRSAIFASYISDSLRHKLFGKSGTVKYTPLAKFEAANSVDYYLVRATSGNKRAALLLAFNKENFGGVLPFLVPDADPATSQITSIDNRNGIVRNITQRIPGKPAAEGKEVYDYDPVTGSFSLVLISSLNNELAEIINPIDTLPRKHKFSGDYVKNKKNFVSIRDSKYPNQLLVFVHIDGEENCTGELKGELLITSANSAIYREGGDPCVLNFRFASNSVSLSEAEGCGSHRGLECTFDGSYPRKKVTKPKGLK